MSEDKDQEDDPRKGFPMTGELREHPWEGNQDRFEPEERRERRREAEEGTDLDLGAPSGD